MAFFQTQHPNVYPAKRRRMTSCAVGLLAFSLFSIGCGSKESVDQSSPPKPEPSVEPAEPEATPKDQITQLCDDLNIEKRAGQFEKDKDGNIVAALLEKSGVKNIAPLKGLPVKTLMLNYTSVYDLAPIAEMPIEFLYLLGTPVKDIGAVKNLPLNSLWLNKTRVTDLSPLKGKPLESLDISETAVADLSPLQGMTSLRRLNLSRCSNLTDLSPLAGLQLQRLTFNPETITKGLNAVRNMRSLQKLHIKFPNGPAYSPAQFWEAYDNGTLPRDSVVR